MNPDNSHMVLAPVIVIILELIAGLFLNVFILAIIFYDFYRQKNLSTSNKIMSCLIVSNVSYNIFISAGLLDEFIGLQASLTIYLSLLYTTLLLYSVGSCSWFTALLGVFYYLKISQARYLSWIKLHLCSIISWMLLVVEVVSFIVSSFSSLLVILPQNSFRNITDSLPSVMQVVAKNRSGLINAVLVATSMPFTIILISTVCTVWLLRRHSHKMERSMETADNGQLMAYMRVVCRMTQSLLFYGIFYTLILIFYFSIVTKFESGFWVILSLMCSFTPVQAALLILGNPRLKNAWKDIFTRLSCKTNEG